MKAHFEMFAAFNAWANRRLFDAVGELSETALKAAQGPFGAGSSKRSGFCWSATEPGCAASTAKGRR